MEHIVPGEAQPMTPVRLRMIAWWVREVGTVDYEQMADELENYAKDLERWVELERRRASGR